MGPINIHPDPASLLHIIAMSVVGDALIPVSAMDQSAMTAVNRAKNLFSRSRGAKYNVHVPRKNELKNVNSGSARLSTL